VCIFDAAYFSRDDVDPVPDTFLRGVRYPMQILVQLLCAIVPRFFRKYANKIAYSSFSFVFAVYAVGCFLGEDPDSTVMAWVSLAVSVHSALRILGIFHKEAVTKRAAVALVAPERGAYKRAYEAVLGAEGGDEAAKALSVACGEVSRACEVERRAFEATVPRFGKHVWYACVPLVREGQFTRSGKPRQATSDFRQAKALNPHFQDWVKSWTGWGKGATYVQGPVKHAGRAIEKCIRAIPGKSWGNIMTRHRHDASLRVMTGPISGCRWRHGPCS